ncbi:MAG: hypothetical protein K2X02_06675 [Alphaproteobacteria bacterium]|nr:hypothetical protein [Alphaproteobacteria bacterium]
MTFMALCLSTSSALYAMNEDEVVVCSSAASLYAGKYEIRRNDPDEQPSGSVMIRQEGDDLFLENFSLIPGTYYYDYMNALNKYPTRTSIFVTKSDAERAERKRKKDERRGETERERKRDKRERDQIAKFVLFTLPTEVIKLEKCVEWGDFEGGPQYAGNARYDGGERAPMGVRLRREGKTFHLTVESPYLIDSLEEFRLFKVGSAEHERLLTPLFAPASGVTPDAELAPGSSSATSSSSTSSSNSAPVVTALESDTRAFHMGVSNSYLTSGFSVPEGPHRWTEGTKASITLSLQHMEPRPTSISFVDTRGLVTADYTQDLTVRVNGVEVGHYVYRPGDNHTIDILLPQVDGQAKIKFEIPKAISPSELGINPDKRPLGISFRGGQFRY